MRNTITINDDLRRVPGSEGLTLESGFIESDPAMVTVFVYRVDLTGSLLNPVPPSVVKFSEGQYAIPKAKCIQLATPRYYREYEESKGNKGIRDEKEAQYEKRTDMKTFLDESRLSAPAGASQASLQLTYASNCFWMFCTSGRPTTDWELQKIWEEFPEYDCVTTIANPSEFAKELGAAFAVHSQWSDVSLSPLDKFVRQLRPPEIGDRVVWIYHGPVVYPRNPAKVIATLPEERQAAVIPFVKRAQFSNQREYRFTVSINGEPKEPEFYLPISTGLRRLAKIEK